MFELEAEHEKPREVPRLTKPPHPGWANLRPQKKGEPSRNPRGRPKKDHDLAAMALEHAKDAIRTLVSVMNNEEAAPASRVFRCRRDPEPWVRTRPADDRGQDEHQRRVRVIREMSASVVPLRGVQPQPQLQRKNRHA